MLSHISLGISKIDASMKFYDATMATIGVKRVWTGERGLGYGRSPSEEKLNLFLQADTGGSLPAGPGFHLAFEAPNREAVDSFHRAALENDGTCAGPPGLRPKYSETYYAAFLLDPDGHKIEIVHQ